MYRIDKTALLSIEVTWRSDVIKKCLALNNVQDKRKHHKCEHFLEWQQCSKCLPLDFRYSLNLFLRRRTALFCGKLLHVFYSATFNSETVFGFGWSFQKSFMHRSPDSETWYLQVVQIWRARWPLFLLNHLQTVRMQALLSDTCCVRRGPCISLKLPLRPAAVGCSLQ